MTELNCQNNIFEIVVNFTSQKSQQLLSNLKQISFSDQNECNNFNAELEKRVKTIYCKMMLESNYNDLACLLQTFFKSFKKAQIKISIVIWLMDNILECVGVTDLEKILKIFSSNIGQCGALEQLDQNRLLKIINHLLKRVSKAQDYHIRGQLQLTLTMILPICHDSGFHRRGTIAKYSQIEPQSQVYNQMGVEGGIGYEFYQQFWSLQRYFMDPNEINNDKQKEGTNRRASLLQLKKINTIINETIEYFNKNPIGETECVQDQPVKFLKILNLLPLQLNDIYFRNIILLQILIFCFTLKNPISGKNSLHLTEEQRIIVQQIEKNTINTLQNSTSNNEQSKIYANFSNFLKNQICWLDLKDNWKEHKKTFLKVPDPKPETSMKDIQQKKKKQAEFIQLMQRVRKQIDQKMCIDGSKLKKFLETVKQKPLKTQPTIPSFTYYYNQAAQCLQTFDIQTGTQNEFESQTQYNIFEWKTMRSLYRQNISDVTTTDKGQSKIKQYRLLNFIHQRKEQMGDIKKKIKPNQ